MDNNQEEITALIQKLESHGEDIVGRMDVATIGDATVQARKRDIRMMQPSAIGWGATTITVYDCLEGQHFVANFIVLNLI